jgi:hypothetical protein
MLHVEVRWQQSAGAQAIWWWKLKLGYQLLKMAAPLQACTKQELRSVIRSLDAECLKPVEIYTRMLTKFSASSMSKTQSFRSL